MLYNQPVVIKQFYKLISKYKAKIFEIFHYFVINYYDSQNHKDSIDFIKKILKELTMVKFDKTNFKILAEIENEAKIEQEKLLDQFIEELQINFEIEINEFIEEQRKKGIHNKRNGYYKRIVKTIYGNKQILVPRDRLAQFFPKSLQKKFAYTNGLIRQIIQHLRCHQNQALCRRIMRENGINISKQIVARIWDLMAKESKEIYENRHFPEHLDAIYLDATYQYVNDGSELNLKNKLYNSIDINTGEVFNRKRATKCCVLQAYGLDLKNNKKIDLSFTICENETIENYVDLLSEIKNKGLKKIDLLIADKHPAIRTAMEIVYSETTKFQQCFIHAKRKILPKVAGRENKRILNFLFQQIKFTNIDLFNVQDYVDEYLDVSKPIKKWLINWFSENFETLTTYKSFDLKYWPQIYTSNFIESQNKKIKLFSIKKGCNYSIATLNKNILISKCNFLKLIYYN